MGFTQIHTDLMYSALDVFLETDSPVRIFRDELGISFETALGNYGLVIPNEDGNWDVLLNDSKVYEIEKEVYSIITHEGNSPPIKDYMNYLIEVSSLPLKEKSLSFVIMTKRGLEFLAVNGKVDLENNFIWGPFEVYKNLIGKKAIIVLN